MRKTEEAIRRVAALAGVLMIVTAEALAQQGPSQAARRIVISIPDRKLAVLEDGRVVKVFPTAVGSPHTPSPTGSYRIVQRVVDPAWYTKGKIVPPGKENPLGTRWLGLSAKGYGIHGTNNPASIGANVSHGCIRLRNRDVEQLFTMVAVGDPVELYNERTPEVESLFAPADIIHSDVASGQ